MSLLSAAWRRRPRITAALDRGAGRRPLAAAATLLASRAGTQDVSFAHEGDLWMYRAGDTYFPGKRSFEYRSARSLARQGEVERREALDYWCHLHTPSEGETVVDVGAGHGAETAVFSSLVGSTGRVLSIEANPFTFRRLEARIRWNGLANVTALNCALVDDRRSMYVENHDRYEINTTSPVRRPDDLSDQIDGFSLDELGAQHGIETIDLLKMNIEGAEQHAIDGMTRMISRVHAVCIACHDFFDQSGQGRLATRQPVVEFLTRAGFDIVTRDEDERAYVRDHVHGKRRR